MTGENTMKYKMICLDIDGTLLDDNKHIQPQVKESLHRASEQGIQIALSTGRMPAGAELIEQELGIECIKICSAGTYTIRHDQCINAEYMPNEAVRNVHEMLLEKFHVPLWIFRDRSWFVTGVDEFVEHEIGVIRYQPEIVDVRSLTQQWEQEGTGANKLLVAANPEIIQEIYREMTERNWSDIDFACSADCFVEISPKGINKGRALAIVCEKLGIDLSETIAFGDQELDIPMVEIAGLGIAMGNAIPELKDVADFVTKSNNEAGIAYALEQYLV